MRNPIADFFIIKNGRILFIIEIKSIHRKKFYPTPREKKQLKRIKDFSVRHSIESYILVDRIGTGISKIWIHKIGEKNA